MSDRVNGFPSCCGTLLALLLALTVASSATAAKEAWDHVANIKDAATRLALLHRREGSPGVLKFLDACYRTQLLASEFSQGLEFLHGAGLYAHAGSGDGLLADS